MKVELAGHYTLSRLAKTSLPMIAMMIVTSVYSIVDGWGLMGAATGTAIALALGGIYPLVYFSSKRNTTHLRFVKIQGIDWKALLKTCTNGMSEYVGNIALNVVSIGYNLQLMKYIGENGVSAYGIIMYVGFIFATVFILPEIVGIDGIWYAVSVAEILAFVMSFLLIFGFRKRYL